MPPLPWLHLSKSLREDSGLSFLRILKIRVLILVWLTTCIENGHFTNECLPPHIFHISRFHQSIGRPADLE